MFAINIENLKTQKYNILIYIYIYIYIYKEEESIEISKIIGFITNIEEYDKIYKLRI